VVLGGVEQNFPGGRTNIQMPPPPPLEDEDMLGYALEKGPGAFYGKMMRRTLLFGMETVDSKVGEDVYFLYQLFAKMTWKDLCVVDEVVYSMQAYSISSVSANHFVPFSAKSLEESPYSVIVDIDNFLRKSGVSEAGLGIFIGSSANGYLQIATFYLIMNTMRPARREIERLYRLWKQYKKDNICVFYTKMMIPLFYHLMPLRGLLAVLLRQAIKVMVLFRRMRRVFLPFNPERLR
jgi:hypothetical protein